MYYVPGTTSIATRTCSTDSSKVVIETNRPIPKTGVRFCCTPPGQDQFEVHYFAGRIFTSTARLIYI